MKTSDHGTIMQDIIGKLRACQTDEDYIREFGELDPWKIKDRYYKDNPEFEYFPGVIKLMRKLAENDEIACIFAQVLKNEYSDSVKLAALEGLRSVYEDWNFIKFEKHAGEDLLLHTIEHARNSGETLLLAAINACKLSRNDARLKSEMLEILAEAPVRGAVHEACMKTLTHSPHGISKCNNDKLIVAIRSLYRAEMFDVLTKAEMARIVCNNWNGDESYAFVAEMYLTEIGNANMAKFILCQLEEHVFSPIRRPSIQRSYRYVNELICKEDDELFVGKWLAYIFYVHAETTFDGFDEVLGFVDSADDDVFQVFIEELRESFSVIPDSCNFFVYSHPELHGTLEKLVRERRHPRASKLQKIVENLVLEAEE